MNIFDNLKDRAIEFLRPGTQHKLDEREVLRQLYDPNNASQAMMRLPNYYCRMANAAGGITGFRYTCKCLEVDYLLTSDEDKFSEHTCSVCGNKFHLYRDLGIVDAEGRYLMSHAAMREVFNKLKVIPSPSATQRQGPRAIDPSSLHGDGSVIWCGHNAKLNERAAEQNNPDPFNFMSGFGGNPW